MRRFPPLLLAFLLLTSSFVAQTDDNGCKLKFTGKARKLVKMRSPNRLYLKFNLGGHLKTGHTWSLQNRPMESGRDERFLRF
jgi:hypothetical protein